ncbi:MAG: hydroxymethylbilane synthase [Dermatophilaceae bacterium]
MTALRLGTRRSLLATTQSEWVAGRLRERGHVVDLVPISTAGDETREPLASLGGTGVFASALRAAVRDGSVDLAVHSLKDLPTAAEPDLVLAAVPTRADARDALVARDGLTLGGLPTDSVLGTGSPRRIAQLAALGLGLRFESVRGNVDTRVRLVDEGALDAVVVARAGLVRLGLSDRVTEVLDPVQVLPAPGQGALAVECRADREDVRAALAPLDDADTRAAVAAERALLAALQGGCHAPVGALAEVVEDDTGPAISLRAAVLAPDGSAGLRRSMVGPIEDPEGLGVRLAALLLDAGASALTPRTPSTGTPADATCPTTPEVH